MAIVLQATGKLELLEQKVPLLETLYIHLFKNNYVPVFGSVLGDFTEADFTGYGPILLADWILPAVLNGSNNGVIFHEPVTWIRTAGSNTIYGYYVTDAGGGGNLYFADRNAGGPLTVDGSNPAYTVLPTFVEATL